MHRIDSSTATPDNRFTEGDPTIPVPATTVTAAWLNAMQEELVAILTAAGIAPNKASNVQVLSAILDLIADSTPGIATNVLNGLCHPDGVSISISANGQLSVVATTPKQSLITVASYYDAGVYNWTVPDINGDGSPWLGWIRCKGSGGGGGASYLSGTRQGGRGGSEGTTVMRHVLFLPGQEHILTVGAGGAAVSGGNISNGNSTSFGSITFASGAGSTKPPTPDEVIVPGAVGDFGQTNENNSNYSQCYGGAGAGAGGGLPGGNGKYGGGGGGGTFVFLSSTPSLGGKGGDGFIEIFRMG